MKSLELSFGLFKRPAFLLCSVLLFLIPYAQIDFYACYQTASQYTEGLTFNKFMFNIVLNKLLFAVISIWLLSALFRMMNSRLGLERMVLSLKGVLKWQAALFVVAVINAIGFFVISIPLQFVVSPIDFGLAEEPVDAGRVMVSQFSFLTFLGLFLGNANLFNSAMRSRNKTNEKDSIIVSSNIGELSLDIDEVVYAEKSGRKYWVYTNKEVYGLKINLTDLARLLEGKGFFRVNRATIVNLNFVDDIRFWEFDKYILSIRSKEKKEFVMSRDRYRDLKAQDFERAF
ncbi:hypothetical protein BFP97_07260 [Roseivirga sp. 4D4]|uniref:LytTR family DNA-binding domain-containing protein n=1 Tax=Roseivirga sp. 4D4 TaxID=1889784 RepID=UPI000853E3C7|nr:LytTR family DNA-binding domain-containing protein [Roseivirga sp. 4D4]OEK01325.1 hypothetical protein BFP97_07260 [Roseivirga sp. 4D4]